MVSITHRSRKPQVLFLIDLDKYREATLRDLPYLINKKAFKRRPFLNIDTFYGVSYSLRGIMRLAAGTFEPIMKMGI